MKSLILFFLALPLMTAGFACDGTSNNVNNTNNVDGPTLVEYDASECLGMEKTIDFSLFDGFECVIWTYSDTGALELRHRNALFNCCPDETLGLTGDVAFADGVFSLTESDNGGDCRCMCRYELVYQLSDVVPSAYSVVVAPFPAPVVMDLSAATEGWQCIDRLGSISYNYQSGLRGSSCTESSECMGGAGYCYVLEGVFSACVDACETVLDCPQPDLEECVEDPDAVSFCRPLTTF